MCGGGIVKLSCHLPDFLERLVRQAHGPTAGSETIDALEFLARVVSHIPDKGQVLQHYYGWYASRVRGMRRKTAEAGEEHPMVCVDPEPEALSEAGKRWAELLRRIFQVDPLACPRCGEEMRIVAFVTEPQIIDRILDHLRRTAPTRPRPRAPPRHGSPPSRPPQPSSALTYPGDHRSGIVGLPGCANHRSDITVHPGFAGNPVLFGRSSRQRDVAMLSRAVGQLQFRAAYLG